MTKKNRLTVAMAVGAIGLGAVISGPAVAIDQKPPPPDGAKEVPKDGKGAKGDKEAKDDKKSRDAARAERRAYRIELRRTKRHARRALRSCQIAPEKLIQVEDSKLLTRLESRFAAKVDSGEWTEEKADRKLARAQKRITLRTAMRAARWSPMLELFGANSRKELGKLLRKAKGMRSLMKDKGVTRADLREAKRDGKLAYYKAAITVCTSGKESAEDEPKKEKPDEKKAPADG